MTRSRVLLAKRGAMFARLSVAGAGCERCYCREMIKRLQAVDSGASLFIDQPLLDLLKITLETELEVTTDGKRLIIAPVRALGRGARVPKAQKVVLSNLPSAPHPRRKGKA